MPRAPRPAAQPDTATEQTDTPSPIAAAAAKKFVKIVLPHGHDFCEVDTPTGPAYIDRGDVVLISAPFEQEVKPTMGQRGRPPAGAIRGGKASVVCAWMSGGGKQYVLNTPENIKRLLGLS